MFHKQPFNALQIHCMTLGPNYHRQYYPYFFAGDNVAYIGVEPGEIYSVKVNNILAAHGFTGDTAAEAVISIDGVNPFTNQPIGSNPATEPGVYLSENGSGYLVAWPEYQQTGRQLAFKPSAQGVGTYVRGAAPFSDGSLAVLYLREGYTPRQVYTLPTSITGTSMRPDYGNYRTQTIGSPRRGDVDVMFQGFQADAVRGDDGLTKGPATGLADWTTQLLSQRQGLIMPVSTGIVKQVVYLWWSELKAILTNRNYPPTAQAPMPRRDTGFNRPVAPLGGMPPHEPYARFVS